MKYLLKPVQTKSNLFYCKSLTSNSYSVISLKDGLIGDFSVSKRNDLYIEHLFIKNEHRHKGFGFKILDFIKILSQKEGLNGRMRVLASLLGDSNNPPHIFYRKYGFTSSDKEALAEIDEYIKLKKQLPKFYKSIYMYI